MASAVFSALDSCVGPHDKVFCQAVCCDVTCAVLEKHRSRIRFACHLTDGTKSDKASGVPLTGLNGV